MVLALVLACTASLFPQSRYVSTPFRPGEQLTYAVKWSFIRLGTVRVRQSLAAPMTGDTMSVEIEGASAAGLPFINVQFFSTALLDVRRPTNIRYELLTGADRRVRTLYATDPVAPYALAVSSENGRITRLDTLTADPAFYEGTGLLMLTRCASGFDTTVTLPTIMDHALGTTTITFSSAIEEVTVPAFGRPIRSHPFHGTTDWVGSSFAGMSGGFRGWVSTDDARRILRAEVQLFLGSARIELEEVGY
ncbi:MAG: DUF3108 domain-containing protein [Bacteroidetes bacterium]|nr:DUF3108 domain-containing protein [Bacteroidota bacterium]